MKKIVDNALTGLLALVLFSLISIFVCANIFHYTAYMEADIASETLFVEVMYESGSINPSTWISSTGHRIMAPTDLAVLIYPLVGYDFQLALGSACCIMMLFVLLSMYLYMKEAGFSVAEILGAEVLAISLTTPGEQVQKMLFLYAAYYTDQVISLFFTLFIYEKFKKKGSLSLPGVVVSAALAILNGLQGYQGLLYCYFPIMAAEIIRIFAGFIKKEKIKEIYLSVWTFVITAISLATSLVTGVYSPESGRNIRHAPEKFLEEVLPAICNIFSSGRLPWLTIIFIVLAIAGYIFAAAGKKSKFRWNSLSFILSVCGYVFVTTFTTNMVSERYYMMIIFAIAVGVSYFAKSISKVDVKRIIAVSVIIYGVFAAADFYKTLIVDDNSETSDQYLVAMWMEDNGYTYGYSTFDHANYITVMSNNAVKVRSVNNMADMEGCKWLTDMTWYPPIKSSDGETCYIITSYLEDDFNKFLAEYNPQVVETAEIGRYMIYVLDKDYTLWERK